MWHLRAGTEYGERDAVAAVETILATAAPGRELAGQVVMWEPIPTIPLETTTVRGGAAAPVRGGSPAGSAR